MSNVIRRLARPTGPVDAMSEAQKQFLRPPGGGAPLQDLFLHPGDSRFAPTRPIPPAVPESPPPPGDPYYEQYMRSRFELPMA